MFEMDTSSLMSGEGKPSAAREAPVKRPSSTLHAPQRRGSPVGEVSPTKRYGSKPLGQVYFENF